jgi:hypothetical protein
MSRSGAVRGGIDETKKSAGCVRLKRRLKHLIKGLDAKIQTVVKVIAGDAKNNMQQTGKRIKKC